jgi:hypothetical protein
VIESSDRPSVAAYASSMITSNSLLWFTGSIAICSKVWRKREVGY